MRASRPRHLRLRAVQVWPFVCTKPLVARPQGGWQPLTKLFALVTIESRITTVTQKNMITIPAEVGRHFGIKPGYRLDWQPVEGKDEILVRVIPDRAELARRLLGAGRRFSPERDAVAELIAERAEEG